VKPGEVLPGCGNGPSATPVGQMTLSILNTGKLPASVSSHVPLDGLSRALRCRPTPPPGAHLFLPAGASVRIEPGAEVEVEVACR